MKNDKAQQRVVIQTSSDKVAHVHASEGISVSAILSPNSSFEMPANKSGEKRVSISVLSDGTFIRNDDFNEISVTLVDWSSIVTNLLPVPPVANLVEGLDWVYERPKGFKVTCLDDDGNRVRVTRRSFDTLEEAEKYASTIAKGRAAEISAAI
jgi:hypothetical protein